MLHEQTLKHKSNKFLKKANLNFPAKPKVTKVWACASLQMQNCVLCLDVSCLESSIIVGDVFIEPNFI
jgi:hypothetical protein